MIPNVFNWNRLEVENRTDINSTDRYRVCTTDSTDMYLL